MKVCSKCKIEKDLTEFHKAKKHKDGLVYDCKSCRYEYYVMNRDRIYKQRMEYYYKNTTSICEYNKKYREIHKEYYKKYYKEYSKEYYQNNIEEMRIYNNEYGREYYEKNKEKMREYNREYMREYKKRKKVK